MNIGTKLKNSRIKKGLTAKQVAALIGRDIQMVYRYESGTCTPPLNVFMQLVSAGLLKRSDLFDADTAA